MLPLQQQVAFEILCYICYFIGGAVHTKLKCFLQFFFLVTMSVVIKCFKYSILFLHRKEVATSVYYEKPEVPLRLGIYCAVVLACIAAMIM